MITAPPKIVSKLGCSLITIHTHTGPSIVSRRKKRLTSAPVMNLGAIVTKTKGIATHITHIKGMKMTSLPTNVKLSTKKKANIATHNLPIKADGTRSLSLAYLAKVALQARPKAVIKPKKSPKKLPKFKES
tara:strand:- start:17 stop:409 length:393 start_codon:yes stop_codon:yes gene_type:complete